MAYTLAQLKYLTEYVVGDPQQSSYSPQMYTDAINFAIKDYARKTGATYTETAATPDANGFCTIPTAYLRINRVLFLVGGTTLTQLVESSFNFESMKSNTWSTLTGTPKRWVLWSGAKIKLTPIPSPIYSATIGYVETPTALALDADTIDARIPDSHGEYLKYAAAAWLLLLDGDTHNSEQADALMNKFNQLIGYADPVLQAKLDTSRTQATREV